MSRIIAAGAVLLALSACSVGIGPGGTSPTLQFQAAVSYQEAYARAVAQAEACLRGVARYELGGGLYEGGQTARMYVQAPVANARMAQVDIAAAGADRSDVTVTMWGKNIWDEQAMLAMRQAIEFGYASCWPSMPTRSPRDPR